LQNINENVHYFNFLQFLHRSRTADLIRASDKCFDSCTFDRGKPKMSHI